MKGIVLKTVQIQLRKKIIGAKNVKDENWKDNLCTCLKPYCITMSSQLLFQVFCWLKVKWQFFFF